MRELDAIKLYVGTLAEGQFPTQEIQGVPAKYNELNRLFVKAAHTRGDRSAALRAVDECCQYAVDNFHHVDDGVASKMNRVLFSRQNGDIFKGLNDDQIRDNIEGLVVLAAMRALIVFARVTFDPNKAPNWLRFVQRYKNVILS